ncbi:MAG TPA: radical SAM protein [Humidesulfovibrio sp.]|uniref:radical SAM protein n=1 Tax=Humidesulfovibrio sp. TaxID=2910988 RepID=UPI002C495222|nr:radical SAM protein [Humidesulfovibrio sp.]HWR02508.1 radical SAM protein [Humidesulfovibrio sp.]
MSLQVCEIFKSLQGESTWAGRPCVFVRLTGCNLRCRWCDTPYAYEGGEALSQREVLERVEALGDGLIEFTGGEPLMQPSAVDLMNALARSGRSVLVETNGSRDISVLAPEVIAIVDMKGPSSGESDKMDTGNLDRLRERDEVKFIIADREDWQHMLNLLPRIDTCRNVVNVSPLFGGVDPAGLARWILESGLDLRLNLQQHKYIWNPDARGV